MKIIITLSDILLKLSSLDINQDSMKKERIHLAELLDYTMEIVSFRENIRIEVSDSLKEMEIIGDFYWISEALINILKNADQMPLCDKIRIDSNKMPLYTSLIIENNGGGIPKEHRRKIFQRFYKKPDSKGFGIGLAIKKANEDDMITLIKVFSALGLLVFMLNLINWWIHHSSLKKILAGPPIELIRTLD